MKLLLMFTTLLNLGFVEPMYEENDGRHMYYIYLSDGQVIEHAYKEEVLEWIQTGTFEYNEALKMEDLVDAKN